MKIQQMRHLVAAADSSSFAQAAKKCFTSRQNIVHSIRELERELNTSLFDRENNELILTPSGQQVVTQAWAILREVDMLQNMFAGNQGHDTALCIAVSENFFSGMPHSAFEYFAKNAERIRIEEGECERCYEAVCSGKADAALVFCMSRSFPSCSTIKIANETAYALVKKSSELEQKQSILVSDLLDQRLAILSQPPFQYAPLFSELDALRFDRKRIDVIKNERLMHHMVSECGSVGIVSEEFVNKTIGDADDVCAIAFEDQMMNWSFYALYQRNASNFKTIIRVVNEFKAAFDAGV